jgi:ribosomal protein S18 acetylase RimI-like enzyme
VDREKRFEYQGPKFPEPEIKPCKYEPENFQKQIDLESEVFYEIRKTSGITPHKIGDASAKELKSIAGFFENNKGTFYQLFEAGTLVGSVLFVGNYIQALAVAANWQGKGYGRKLTKFAVNKILDSGYSSVVLHTLPGNQKAERLFLRLGFREVQGLSAKEEMNSAHFDRLYAAHEKSTLVPKIYRGVWQPCA